MRQSQDAITGTKPDFKVLEIGFGPGDCILALAQLVGNQGKVYGIDISEGMRDLALAKVKKAGLFERVKLRCCDAIQLPFEDNIFDAIFMSFTLELFDTHEIPIVLLDCLRVLKGGGRICVISMTKKGKQCFLIMLYELFHRCFPSLIDCRPIYVQESVIDAGFNIFKTKGMIMGGLPVEIIIGTK